GRSEEAWGRYRERAAERGATARRLRPPDEGLVVLLERIAAEGERLEGVLAAHLARAESEGVEGPGFEGGREAERPRRYQLRYNRPLLRILETLRKRRREAAREGAAGSSRRRIAAPTLIATNEAKDAAGLDVGSESEVFTHRSPPPADPPPVGPPDIDPIRSEVLPRSEIVTNEADRPAASDPGSESAVRSDRCPAATDDLPERSPESDPEPMGLAAGSATNEATGPAPSDPRPGPLVRALALVALLVPVSAGHSARIAAGSGVGRAVQPDADRIGPDRTESRWAARPTPIGPDGVRSPDAESVREGERGPSVPFLRGQSLTGQGADAPRSPGPPPPGTGPRWLSGTSRTDAMPSFRAEETGPADPRVGRTGCVGGR